MVQPAELGTAAAAGGRDFANTELLYCNLTYSSSTSQVLYIGRCRKVLWVAPRIRLSKLGCISQIQHLGCVKFACYAPPPEFQEADVETLVKEALSDTTELWLIQIPLNQLQPADFVGKQLSLKLSKGDGLLGRLRNSHDKSFDMVSMGSQVVEPFAFIPRPSASMGVRRIARHVRLQSSSEENADSLGKANSSVGFSGSKDRATVNEAVQSLGASVGSVGHKSSQVVSGMSYEGGETSTLSGKRSRKERQTNGTPIASYAKNLEESGAYNSSEPQGQSFVTPKVKEQHSTGGKKKSKKHGSEV